MHRHLWPYGGALLAFCCALGPITRVHAEGDTVPPTGSITLPVNKSAVKSLTAIRGVAADNVGVTRAAVTLYRAADAKSWNGTAWITGPATLEMTVSPPGGTTVEFGRTAGLPQPGTNLDNQLPEGRYYVYGSAFDAAGHAGTLTAGAFVVDRTAPPSPTITSPLATLALKTFPPIRGTASDNDGGGGIDHVSYVIRRNSDGKFWNGAAWATTSLYFNVSVSGGNWAQTAALPSGDSLLDGLYTIYAYSYDRVGLRSAEPAQSKVSIDRTAPPKTVITTPQNGSSQKALTAIAGLASDNSGGSGVSRVIYSLRRAVDNKYWNGSAWDTPAVSFTAMLSGSKWSQSGALPADADLVNGSYLISAYTYDQVGQHSSEPALSYFRIDNAAPTLAITSPAPGSTIKTLTSINGSALDDSGTVSRVMLSLRRLSDGKYWNGTEWVSTLVSQDAAITQKTFAYTALPTGTQLLDGYYLVQAYAYDTAGNHTPEPARSNFRLDRTALTATVAYPANASVVTSLPYITGTATNSAGGVAHVFVSLSRNKSGGGVEFWAKRGSVFGWGANTGDLVPAVLASPGTASTKWTTVSNLPSGTILAAGQYFVSVVADDGAGTRFVSQPYTFQVGPVTVDSIAVSSPADGATITALTGVEGHAVDAQKVSQVAIVLLRTHENVTQIWGSRSGVLGWGTTANVVLPLATLTTANSTDTTFHINTGLPSGTALLPGVYSVAAQSTDGNGAVLTSAANLFTVSGTTAFAYAGKYNVTFSTAEGGTSVDSGVFVLSVDNDKKAVATFIVDSLKGIDGTGTLRADGASTAAGTVVLKKITDGDSFAGSYTGFGHDNGSDPSQDASLALTVSTTGAATMHVTFVDQTTADFSGTVNLTSGEFSLSGRNGDNPLYLIAGTLKRHDGSVSLSGTVSATGVVTAGFVSDGNANGDTFSGDLDSLGSAPMRGAGTVTDTGTNDDGPGDGSVTANWSSQRQ